jgi:hypothetical protein
MAYKKYIKRDGKLFGPYYYESYRDSDGNVKTRYLVNPPKKESFSFKNFGGSAINFKGSVFVIASVLIALLLIIFVSLFVLQGNYNSDLSFSENVKKVNTFDEVFNFQ